MLLFIVIMSTANLFVPGMLAEKVKQSAWISAMLGSLAGFICLWLVCKLGKRFPQQTLPQYSVIILGKPLGKIIGGAYVLFFLLINVLVIREFSDMLCITLMPETPGYIFVILFVLIGAYAAAKGIEVIARMTQFILPIFLVTILYMMIFTWTDVDLGKLFPLLEGGISPVIKSSVIPAAWYGEIVILVILLPMVNKPEEVMRKGIAILSAVTVSLTAEIVVCLGVFGPTFSGALLFPFWYLIESVEFGSYLQRMESFFIFIWLTGIVIKVAVFFYIGCYTTAQVLNLKNYRLVLFAAIPVHILGAVFLFSNTSALWDFLEQLWPPIASVFELGLPCLLLAVAVIRKKKKRI